MVGIVGAGRVGSALARAFTATGMPVAVVASRSASPAARLAAQVGADVGDADELMSRATLVVLAVPDDALDGLVGELTTGEPGGSRAAVVHCSGARGLDVLAPLAAFGHEIGAFHPLQAFPTARTPLQPGVAVAVTADGPLQERLLALARRLNTTPLPLADADRPRYHAAAVMASNFTATLTAHASGLLTRCGLSRQEALDALLPLLRSTLDGLEESGLPGGLTGPLVRGDAGTVARHLAVLDAHPDDAATARLYRAAAAATLPFARERGLPCDVVADLESTLAEPPGPRSP